MLACWRVHILRWHVLLQVFSEIREKKTYRWTYIWQGKFSSNTPCLHCSYNASLNFHKIQQINKWDNGFQGGLTLNILLVEEIPNNHRKDAQKPVVNNAIHYLSQLVFSPDFFHKLPLQKGGGLVVRWTFGGVFLCLSVAYGSSIQCLLAKDFANLVSRKFWTIDIDLLW